MKSIAMDFDRWCLYDDNRYMLVHFETNGANLEEMLDNAQIFIEDWRGTAARLNWDIGDLHAHDYNALEEIMLLALAD